MESPALVFVLGVLSVLLLDTCTDLESFRSCTE
jgi:hypothetical protein